MHKVQIKACSIRFDYRFTYRRFIQHSRKSYGAFFTEIKRTIKTAFAVTKSQNGFLQLTRRLYLSAAFKLRALKVFSIDFSKYPRIYSCIGNKKFRFSTSMGYTLLCFKKWPPFGRLAMKGTILQWNFTGNPNISSLFRSDYQFIDMQNLIVSGIFNKK